MEHDIVRKLRSELDRGISTEPQVVYFMVKIRKLLDLDGGGEYSTLRLCCNWTVHVELSNSHAQKIVQVADALYVKIVNGTLDEKEKDELRGVFSLDRFRGELNQFLTDQRLRTLSDPEWNAFLASFLNAIDDIPLKCKPSGTNATQVNEVVLIKEVGDSDRVPDGKAPPILWALCLDGKPRFVIGANFELSDKTVESFIDFGKRRDTRATPHFQDI